MKDWSEIKADYIRTGGSLRSLAKRHGVSFHSVAKACRRENWPLLRRVHSDGDRAATLPATTGEQTATIASDNPLSLPQRSSALKVSLVRELERDVEAVQQHHPATLEIAAQRQGVLRDVATTAKAALDWGSGVPVPAIRIGVLAQVTIGPPPPACLPAIEAGITRPANQVLPEAPIQRATLVESEPSTVQSSPKLPFESPAGPSAGLPANQEAGL